MNTTPLTMRAGNFLTTGPDGKLYFTEVGFELNGTKIRRVEPPMPDRGLSGGTIIVPSGTGDELYRFDSRGRHLDTLDALTGAVRFVFAYDANGVLTSLTDGSGRTTTLHRNATVPLVRSRAPSVTTELIDHNADALITSVRLPTGRSTHHVS